MLPSIEIPGISLGQIIQFITALVLGIEVVILYYSLREYRRTRRESVAPFLYVTQTGDNLQSCRFSIANKGEGVALDIRIYINGNQYGTIDLASSSETEDIRIDLTSLETWKTEEWHDMKILYYDIYRNEFETNIRINQGGESQNFLPEKVIIESFDRNF
jgi:hypothetical protein